MRLKTFILNESRSKNIDFDEATNIIKTKCKKAYDTMLVSPIFRGVENNTNSMFVDPKKGKPRKSANTKNYYTYIIDNSPAWKNYPKRSKSIICTTDAGYAMGFGTTYRVFPYDGAKIGVCPTGDLWSSFWGILKDDLDSVNDALSKIFDFYGVKLDDSSYKMFKESFKVFDNSYNVFNYKKEYIYKHFPYNIEFIKELLNGYNGKNFYKKVENMFNPKKNEFELKKIGDSLPVNKEVWTDSKSVLINETMVKWL